MAEELAVKMRDPHVVAVRYKVVMPDDVTFGDAPEPIEREFEGFRLHVTGSTATAEMTNHYTTKGEARRAVEEVLRPWVVHEELDPRGSSLRFVFEGAEIIDRAPPSISVTASVAPKPTARVQVLRELRLPDLPEVFVLSPDVEVMWNLYEAYRQGRDRLLPMAYTCLTRLLYGAGGMKEAARTHQISVGVLRKLSEISSTVGDETDARKWKPGQAPRPLTDRERDWVESAIRKIILRAGQHAADPNRRRTQITIAHLPEL